MMRRRSGTWIALSLALWFGAASLPFAARAEDFLSTLFGGFRAPPPAPSFGSPFVRERVPIERPRHHASHGGDRASYGGGQAWCVRTCDGRYFPLTGPANSRAESCSSFCPESKTTLVFGSEIDDAVTESGRSYSDLPNAFRYRNELVAGCSCNGKDPVGLAAVSIDNDPTLRKGDIIAGARELEVARHDADRRGGPNLSPLPRAAQARYRHLPVVAAGR